MADSPLARLHAWSTDHACAVIAIADEDSFEDPAAAALLRFALGDVDDLGSKPELVLVATPERLQLHCSASALSGVRALLGATAAPLPVDVCKAMAETRRTKQGWRNCCRQTRPLVSGILLSTALSR